MSLEKNARFMVTTDEDLDGKDDSDDDPMMDDDGYTEMTPSFDENEMLDALEDPAPTDSQAELEPQEAYETMLFQAPLSEEEAEIIDTTPMLYEDPRKSSGNPIRWVDDPDHSEWILQRMKERHKAMDEVLEDQMYGDDIFGERSLSEEERIERAGSEVGLRMPKFVRRAARGIKRGVKGVVRGFSRGRDAKKATMVKKLYGKLVREHANFLQVRDAKRGTRRPRAFYENVSKQWARNKIQQAGLPTSFTAGTETAASIMGDSTMGSWWNPFSWFEKKTQYVLINTRGERVAEMNSTEYQAFAGTRAAQMVAEQEQQQAQPEQQRPQEQAPTTAQDSQPQQAQYDEEPSTPPEEPAPDDESTSGW